MWRTEGDATCRDVASRVPVGQPDRHDRTDAYVHTFAARSTADSVDETEGRSDGVS